MAYRAKKGEYLKGHVASSQTKNEKPAFHLNHTKKGT